MKLSDGRIYKGIYENHEKNGIFLEWMPDGLLQGTYKDGKMNGIIIANSKHTGNSIYSEVQKNIEEGLSAIHESDCIIWGTYSKY
jgi:hypothetical protein